MRARLSLALAAALLLACGDDDGHHSHERPLGEADAFAMAACDAAGATGATVTAGTEGEPSPIALGPTPLTVAVSAERGFIEITTTEMHTSTVLSVAVEGRVVSLRDAAGPIPLSTPFLNAICHDAVPEEYRLHFHEPGARVLELSGGEPVWLSWDIESVGHFDAGAHDHDAGAHEDAGHSH